MPLDEDREGRHGAGQARLQSGPAPVPALLERADARPQGTHHLDEPTVRPRPALPPWQVGGGAGRRLPAGVAPDQPAPRPLAQAPWTGGSRALSGGPRPPHAPPPWVEHETQWAPAKPPVLRAALPAERRRAAPRAQGGEACAAAGVQAPAPRRGGHASPRPSLRGGEEPTAPGARGQPWTERSRGARPPALKGPRAPAWERLQAPEGAHRTGPQVRRGGLGEGGPRLSALAAPGGAQRDRGHPALLSRQGDHPAQRGEVV